MIKNILFVALIFSAFLLNAQGLERNTLNEVFTSSTCGPCRPGNIQSNLVWNNSTETPIIIKYQMSWPGSGDPYFTAEGNVRRNYYGVNSVPYMTIDGGWNGNSNSYTNFILDQYSSISAFLDIASNFNVNGQTVDMQIALRPLTDLPGNNVLHVAIIEKKTFNNIKSNGETEFENVMKKMVPNASGTSVGSLKANESKTFNMSYTFQGSYRLPANASSPINHSTEHSVEEFTDLGVVVFVQNVSTKEIYHGAYGFSNANLLDISLSQLTTPSMVNTGASTPIEGMLINNGSTSVTSFDVTYKINTGFSWKTQFTGQNIAAGDTFYFAHPKNWVPTIDGNYTVNVVVDNINGGGANTYDDLAPNNFMSKQVAVSAPTALLPTEDTKIHIYPNPAQDVVFLQNLSNSKVVEVYNSIGERLTVIELNEESTKTLKVGDYKQGVYLLKISSGTEVVTEKLIVR